MKTSTERKEVLRDAMLVEIARGVEMLLDAVALQKPMSGGYYSQQSGRIQGARLIFVREVDT